MTYGVKRWRHFLRACTRSLSPLILCLALITSLRAQERVRTFAGQLPIQGFRRAPVTFFRLGPFDGNVTGSVGVEYTDNANLANTNKISRVRFDQGLTLDVVWVLSHLNQLEIVFGGLVTEDIYGNGKNQTNFSITPGSKIEYKFAVSNFRFTLFDQYSYVEDPTTDPTVANITYLRRFTNTVGGAIDADLGIAILSLSADYTYSDESGTNVQGSTTTTVTSASGIRHTGRVGLKTTFSLTPTIFYGLDTSVSRSTGTHAQNVNSFSVGPFTHGKLGPALDFDLAAGANLLDAHPSIPPGYYANGVLRHQTTHNLQLILSASRDLIFTNSTNLTEETEFRLAGRFNMTRFITLTAAPFYNFGNEKSGVAPGNFTQYGVEVSLSWKPRKRWSTSVTYDYIRRTADLAINSYIQNRIAFDISYSF
jgi:hypothetical protein